MNIYRCFTVGTIAHTLWLWLFKLKVYKLQVLLLIAFLRLYSSNLQPIRSGASIHRCNKHEFRWLMYIVHNHCIAQRCMTLVTDDCVLCPSILLCLGNLPESHIRKWWNLLLTFDPLPIKLVVESLTLSQSFWTNLHFYRDIRHSGDLGPRYILSCTTQVSLDTS